MKHLVYSILTIFLLAFGYYILKHNNEINRDEIIAYIKNNEPIVASIQNHSRFYKYKNYGILISVNGGKLFEVKAMKYFRENGIKNVKEYFDVFYLTKYIVVVSRYLSGQNIKDVNITNNHMKKLINSFFLMDKILFWNFDLNASNILVDKNEVYFLDFDGSYYIDNDGHLLFIGTNNESNFCADTKDCLIKYLSVSSSFDDVENPYYDIYLPIPSNLHNFEYRTLSHILNNKKKQSEGEEKLFFTQYLKEKSNYYLKRYKVYRKILNNSVLPKIKDADKIEKGLRLEKAISDCLKIKNQNIYNIEYSKVKIKRYSFEYRHSDVKGIAQQKLKKGTDRKINELFVQIEQNLDELKKQQELDNDILLYIQANINWLNYWKNYNNEQCSPN